MPNSMEISLALCQSRRHLHQTYMVGLAPLPEVSLRDGEPCEWQKQVFPLRGQLPPAQELMVQIRAPCGLPSITWVAGPRLW
jgi:hypothetical protein